MGKNEPAAERPVLKQRPARKPEPQPAAMVRPGGRELPILWFID
jgi:hypothetical protein